MGAVGENDKMFDFDLSIRSGKFFGRIMALLTCYENVPLSGCLMKDVE